MATTSTFNLRKLIQTRLHQDDTVIDDDTSSCYEDDQRNPIKKRITTWLGPRGGSTFSAGHTRSCSDSVSPLSTHQHPHAHQDHHYQQGVQEDSELLRAADPCSLRPAKRLDPKRRTLDDVPSMTNLDLLDILSAQGNPDSSNAHIQRRARPQTFLASPVLSSHFKLSPPIGSLDDSFAVAADPNIMETSLEDRSDPTLNRQSWSRDWSEGVRQLIEETDLAFESVGSAFDVHNSLDLPRMSQDMSRSNPDLTAQLAPSPLLVEKPGDRNVDKENVGTKLEAPLDIPPRRSFRVKEDALKAERRKSRSVPPPIHTRRPSSPQGPAYQRKPPSLASPPPMSARDPSNNPTANSHNQTPPLKSTSIIHRRPRQPSAYARRPSRTTRWAIPDNVTDIFTGNVFKRNEVDELLTPEQLEMLKQKREEAKRKESQLNSPRASDESETSWGSSEQEGLGRSSESCKGSKSSHETQPSKGGPLSHKSRPSQGIADMETFGNASETSASSDDAERRSEGKQSSASEEDDEDLPPTPPKKSEGRLRKQASERNKIQENDDDEGLMTFDLLGEPSPLDVSDSDEPPLPPKNPRRYAPPTKGLPHIPTNENAKRRKGSTTLKPEEDDEYLYLKSTPFSLTTPYFRHGPIAFAKSEIGKGALTMDETLDWTAFQMAILGAGDFLHEVYDDGDSKLVEDVMEWFGDFGFETHGHLIPEDSPPSPRSSSRSTISSAASENDIRLPVDDRTQNWAYDTANLFQGKGHRRRGYSSPPQSPLMAPIVVDEDAGKIPAYEDMEDPPMGYNLQGDLGDFLQWEAQHALGSGYYGPL